MTPLEPLSKFDARPGQTLAAHLAGVAEMGETLINGAGQTPYGEDWVDVIETIAWVHDIGKLTSYFQTYLETGFRTEAPRPELTHHGTFGGIVAVLALAARGMSKQTTAAGFYAVTKHHSVLPDMRSELSAFSSRRQTVDDRYEIAEQQLESIDESASEAAEVVLRRATRGAWGWDDFTAQGLATARHALRDIRETGLDKEFYGCALRAWSTLVAADKADASGLNDSPRFHEARRPDARALDALVRGLSETVLPDGEPASRYLDKPERPLPTQSGDLPQRIAALRTAANGRATPALLSLHAAGDRVFELTLPTGFGKTYTGLRAGLSLAEALDSRVIYALPYTSIIDQVDHEIQQVFGLSPLDPEYTVHHHLADTRTVMTEYDSPSNGRDTLHAESWRAGLVLTTFTQLFESAAGPSNVQSMKLPALQDSVIIIDEPQAISLDWWALVGRLTEHLSTEYNATTILMTATQPRILSQLSIAPTPTPLIDLHHGCTALLSEAPRVTFDLHKSLINHLDGGEAGPLSLTDGAATIDDDLGEMTNALAIVNTVESVAALTSYLATDRLPLGAELLDYLKTSDSETFDPEAYLDHLAAEHPDTKGLVASLTTRLRPRDRRSLLQCLGSILDTETETPFDEVQTVTVSTQLIEAGVDLSFDRLYRDYGPIPSIVQAAGRCNRRFGNPAASVTIWRLDSPAGRNYIPSQLIYGDRSLLRPTAAALNDLRREGDQSMISEGKMLTTGVETYYETLHSQRGTATREDGLVAAFYQAKGEKLRNASVVSQEYPTQDVFVLVTEADVDTFDEYERHRQSGEWSRARKAFQSLKPALVSVPVAEEPEDDRPLFVRVDDLPRSYDLETGRGVIIDGIGVKLEV